MRSRGSPKTFSKYPLTFLRLPRSRDVTSSEAGPGTPGKDPEGKYEGADGRRETDRQGPGQSAKRVRDIGMG